MDAEHSAHLVHVREMQNGVVPLTQEGQGFQLSITMTINISDILQFADIILSIILVAPHDSQ